jgi:hypothetical protein
MVTAAALCSLVLGLGFGLPAIVGARHFAETGEVWTFLGFPTYGGGPFERLGLPTSVPLLIGFALPFGPPLGIARTILLLPGPWSRCSHPGRSRPRHTSR